MVRIFLIGLLAVAFSSCNDPLSEIDPTKAQLNIYVYAVLTGNPKDHATVSVHLTESDANNGINEVVGKRFTDLDGNVATLNLALNTGYALRC